MPDAATHFDEVGAVAKALTDLGLNPILVGGMALVIIGSRGVTRDFDSVVAEPGERLPSLVDLFYDRGLGLAPREQRRGRDSPAYRIRGRSSAPQKRPPKLHAKAEGAPYLNPHDLV